MSVLSQKQTVVAGLALILVVNALAIASVAYNRHGQPESTLRLDQRELREPYSRQDKEENSGIALTLKWRVPQSEAEAKQAMESGYYEYGEQQAYWLDADKLAALGYDVRRPPRVTDCELSSYPYPRKEVLLVLEQDGPAYQQSLTRVRRFAAGAKTKVDEARAAVFREENKGSRLFIVDAGLGTAALRAKYPDRSHYALARGLVQPHWICDGKGKGQHISGTITALSVDAINIPISLRPVFEGKISRPNPDSEQNGHVFEATVNFGNRLEPWLTDAKAR
jgi:hypothetical protein